MGGFKSYNRYVLSPQKYYSAILYSAIPIGNIKITENFKLGIYNLLKE